MAIDEIERREQAYIQYLDSILGADKATIRNKDFEYQGSWSARGGVGAAMNLFRKADRLESQMKANNWNVWEALAADRREEGLIDDIRDLRRYLALIEAKAILLGIVALPMAPALIPELDPSAPDADG